MTSQPFLRSVPLVAAMMTMGLVLNSGLAWADFIPPSNLGRPGNREGAATRGDCKIDVATNEPGLTALVPQSNIGLTTTTNPTIYWYLPKNNYQVAQIMLYQATPTGQTLVQEVKFPLAGRPTLDSFTFNDQPLAVDQDYRWILSLICNPADSDPSQIQYVDGWVRRVTPSETVSAAVTDAQGLKRYQVYAASGLWYDALATLVNLGKAQPQNPEIRQEWVKLLNGSTVQLPTLGQKMATTATQGQP